MKMALERATADVGFIDNTGAQDTNLNLKEFGSPNDATHKHAITSRGWRGIMQEIPCFVGHDPMLTPEYSFKGRAHGLTIAPFGRAPLGEWHGY
jgi:hypothetical protein